MRGSFSIREWLKKVMLGVNMMHLPSFITRTWIQLNGGLALKMSFKLCWQVDGINSVDKTNLLCFTALTSKWCLYFTSPKTVFDVDLQVCMWSISCDCPFTKLDFFLDFFYHLWYSIYNLFFLLCMFKFFHFLGWTPCMGLSILFMQ